MAILRRVLNREKEISQKAIEIVELIISEIGAEIHDDLIQRLSVIKLHLDKIERSSFDPAETKESIARMQADFLSVTDAVRKISRRLMPVYSEDDSFECRLDLLCQNLSSASASRVQLTKKGIAQELPDMVVTHLLRMIQELVHNSFRHSSAWHVWVTLEWKAKELFIIVEDDGSGVLKISQFLANLQKKHNSLRLRSELIGSKVNFEAGTRGLRASIKLPLQ